MRLVIVLALLALGGCNGKKWVECEDWLRVCPGTAEDCEILSIGPSRYRLEGDAVHWEQLKGETGKGVIRLVDGRSIDCGR
jgi:hypothetical protein